MRSMLKFIFLLFLPAALQAQQVELLGRFSTSFIGGETIRFTGRDSFYFDGFYCTNGATGKGTCEIRNNYLYLYFEKLNEGSDSLKTPVFEKAASQENQISIGITCFDEDEKPVPAVSLEVQVNDLSKYYTTTDSSGRAMITIPGEKFPVVVNTQDIRFESLQMKLRDKADYKIQFPLRYNKSVYEKLDHGEVLIYEIDDLSEDAIKMRPIKSKGPYRNYQKVTGE